MLHLGNNEKKEALSVISAAIEEIESVAAVSTSVFKFERERSIEQLKGTLQQLQNFKVGELEIMEADLENAVEEEDYERAMRLRDQISVLKNKS